MKSETHYGQLTVLGYLFSICFVLWVCTKRAESTPLNDHMRALRVTTGGKLRKPDETEETLDERAS